MQEIIEKKRQLSDLFQHFTYKWIEQKDHVFISEPIHTSWWLYLGKTEYILLLSQKELKEYILFLFQVRPQICTTGQKTIVFQHLLDAYNGRCITITNVDDNIILRYETQLIDAEFILAE